MGCKAWSRAHKGSGSNLLDGVDACKITWSLSTWWWRVWVNMVNWGWIPTPPAAWTHEHHRKARSPELTFPGVEWSIHHKIIAWGLSSIKSATLPGNWQLALCTKEPAKTCHVSVAQSRRIFQILTHQAQM
jgi:hypothetical protein